MQYQTFTEVFTANDRIRERLIATVSGLDDNAAAARPDINGWSVTQIVEHISIVDEGMCKICAKLLSDAGENGSGSVYLSPEFIAKMSDVVNTKLKAPERVRPTGEQSIAESLSRLSSNSDRLNEIRDRFEIRDTTEKKFPHPYFGDLSAAEWLVLRGLHESRHIDQIARIIRKS
jgi:hypothetical protein